LQTSLTTNFARYIARKKIPFLKRYHIGKIYKKNMKLASTNPQELLEASFDIIAGGGSGSSGGIGSHNFKSGDEVIYEAELLKICD
jgi:hypothetical protein